MIDRTLERKARILGEIPVMKVESGPVDEKPKQLGPNQLAWLRATVPSFEICERLALGSEEHRQRLLEAVKS
jgi:hypothetical protein